MIIMFKKINNLFVFIKEKLLKDDLHKLKKSDVLFFCHDNNRGIDFNGKAYSPILDSYSEELQSEGYTVQTLAHPWSKLNANLAFGYPLLFNRSYFIAKITDKVFKKNKLKYLYLNIFKRVMPKKIITIGCNDALCQAARELNIQHIEILHGFGYDTIPWGWEKKNKQSLPQYVYSFDQVSTETFGFLNKYDVKVIQVENPFLKRFEKNKLQNLPFEWRVASRPEFKKQILISLQWGYASGIDCYPEFEGVLDNGLFPIELLKVIEKTGKEVLWRFRFHPVHYRNQEKYKRHFNFIESIVLLHENCEWMESTYKALPSILIHCDAHITMSSMSVYESSYFQVPSLALCPTLREGGINQNLFDDLVIQGMLQKSDATLQIIESWLLKSCFNLSDYVN